MSADFLTSLVPVLGARTEAGFNIFDVMHHGTHEKQLSNVFSWLLDAEGTHGLGGAFQEIFLEAVNHSLAGGEPLPLGLYGVRQEVNTSAIGDGMDIADIVLDGESTTIVVEHYYTSSGHGHDYDRYLKFGAREGKRSAVVMLCETENRAALADGWENASVVTYQVLLTGLQAHVAGDGRYRAKHPDQCSFFEHMTRRFVRGRKVNNEILVDFIDVLCQTGEARHFGARSNESAAAGFADRVHQAALTRFNDSRELLGQVKTTLRGYGERTLLPQINVVGDLPFTITKVSANYQGIYQWTINFETHDATGTSRKRFQIKFGPSAWKANQDDPSWKTTVPADEADYARLFLTCGKEIRQSSVSMQEVVDGHLTADDHRLCDELVTLLRDHADADEVLADQV